MSDGRQVLRFRPTRWERTYQRLEITTGELLPDQEIPLLKSRRELSRAELITDGHFIADQQQPPATALSLGGSPRPTPL
ncbi:DUF1651 domain-containing protein [Synechococcus sp. 1G10]|uniref:DUF1651 domain-containing protein n=1 Tax=Synechococcus sp. 1G10 TaxID=2025605 RepID=UPI001E3D2F07|nr:DUF1651 domain-containing protein [Synechococcus sp. 1G10]